MAETISSSHTWICPYSIHKGSTVANFESGLYTEIGIMVAEEAASTVSIYSGFANFPIEIPIEATTSTTSFSSGTFVQPPFTAATSVNAGFESSAVIIRANLSESFSLTLALLAPSENEYAQGCYPFDDTATMAAAPATGLYFFALVDSGSYVDPLNLGLNLQTGLYLSVIVQHDTAAEIVNLASNLTVGAYTLVVILAPDQSETVSLASALLGGACPEVTLDGGSETATVAMSSKLQTGTYAAA
jgi:hypothetical protein